MAASHDRPAPARDDETASWSDLDGTASESESESEAPGTPETGPTAGLTARRTSRTTPPGEGFDWFARVVVEIGLIEPDELREALIGLGKGAGGPPIADAGALARGLVREGRLTAYQAAALLQGKSRGLVIGNYVVLDRVGSGGMGIVFKAQHRRMKRVVALKVLPPSFSKNKVAVVRFQREAEAVAHLSHPNIVAALDADEFNGLHFLAMEFVDGTDLTRLVSTSGPLAVDRAVGLVIQAARGLGEAHSRGIIHRDVKPSNLLLDANGTVKVSDLGLARIRRGADLLGGHSPRDTELTRDGSMMGTVDFMSPEQAYDLKQADHRSDVYSLGCTLYYLLTGRVPFPGVSLMERLLAHREVPAPSLLGTRDDVPPALDSVYLRMLAKAPEARYPSMDALIVDLENCPPPLAAPPRAGDHGPITRDDATMIETGRGPRRTVADTVVLGPIVRDDATMIEAGREVAGSPIGSGRGRGPGRTVADTVILDGPVPRPSPVPMSGVWERSRRAVSRRSAIIAVALIAMATVGFLVGHRLVGIGDPVVAIPTPRGPQEGREHVAVRDPGATGPSPKTTTPIVPAPEATTPVVEVAPPGRVGVVDVFRHGEGMVEAVAVSADGTLALSGGIDGMARLWRLKTKEVVLRLPHDGPVFAVAIAPDGRRALTAGGDRVVRLWDLATGADLGRFEGHAKKVNAVAFSPGGGRVATASDDGTVRIWDPETRRQLVEAPHEGRVNALAFALSPGGLRLLAAGSDGTVRVLDSADGSTLARLDEGEGAGVFCLSASPDGRLAVWGGEGGRISVSPLDAPGLPSPRRLDGGPRDWVRCVAFLPDGRRAIAGYEGGKLQVRDVEDGIILHTFADDDAGRLGVAVLPDGAHALTSDDDGHLRLWLLPPPLDATRRP